MSKLIAFRLSDDEVADLDARAAKAGVSRSSFIRDALFDSERGRITPEPASNTPKKASSLPPFSESWRR